VKEVKWLAKNLIPFLHFLPLTFSDIFTPDLEYFFLAKSHQTALTYFLGGAIGSPSSSFTSNVDPTKKLMVSSSLSSTLILVAFLSTKAISN
jgi:hypothetical protein